MSMILNEKIGADPVILTEACKKKKSTKEACKDSKKKKKETSQLKLSNSK